MSKSSVAVWIFNEIAGAHPTWTLAIFAISEKDARNALKAHFRSGKFVIKHQSKNGEQVNIIADCGLTTEAASTEIRNS